MPANRMNRDEFYTAMAANDDARLRKILWTLYWRGNAQLRERIEDELRSPEQPKMKPKKKMPDPDTVLDEVTTFVTLAKDGAYMAGDRRVHHTERSKWRLTFRRLAGDALAALQADDPGPAQQAVAEMVNLARDMKSYDYFHSDDPVEAAKFVVSDAVDVLWESVLRHDGFAAFARRVPEQLIRWEADYGWTRRGYGQVPEIETALAVPLARLLTTPDMWRTFAESYLDALDAAGRADPRRPRAVYGSFDETRFRRRERAKDLAAWHEMLLDRFAGAPEDELLDRLAVSPALAGPELTFLRARIAERRGDVTQAAALVTECLQELPGHPGYLDLAVEVSAELPPRARELLSERTRILGEQRGR
ncbi:MAG: hypothetical protein ACRDPY_28975 [Streptosporangiaceae bacterium]